MERSRHGKKECAKKFVRVIYTTYWGTNCAILRYQVVQLFRPYDGNLSSFSRDTIQNIYEAYIFTVVDKKVLHDTLYICIWSKDNLLLWEEQWRTLLPIKRGLFLKTLAS